MPSASPFLNQFPSVLSDTDCPYRYPAAVDCSDSSNTPYPAAIPTPTPGSDPSSSSSSSCSSSSSSSSSSTGLPPLPSNHHHHHHHHPHYPHSTTLGGHHHHHHPHHKLPPSSDYDPFKFLSAMAEQSLSGNFAGSASVSSSSQVSQANPSNFLFSPHHTAGSPMTQNGLMTSPGAMTSSMPQLPLPPPPPPPPPPPQFYASQSACCMYSNGSGGGGGGGGGVVTAPHRPGGYSPAGRDVMDSYHQPQQQQPQQQPQQQQQQQALSLNPRVGGNGGGGGGEGVSCRKNFFCTTDDLIDGTDGGDSLLSWTRQHPEHWSRTEVLDWLFFVAQERGLDMRDFRGEAFQSLTGSQLCRMSVEDFTRLEPQYGVLLYQMFKKLLSGDFISPPEGYWKQERPDWKPERSDSLQSDVIDIDSYDFDLTDPPNIPNPAPMVEPCPQEYEMFGTTPVYHPSNSGPMRAASCYYPGCPYPPQFSRRRPGRPRVKSLPEEDDRAAKDKKVKNQHLWEFIYETLLNPLYNPQYLRWENQREGVFRFVQSEAVAQLWGSRKNNENMTYEKLSRAMRHYYKRGILERVEGRRLVYKFSRKAMDRAREKRHNSV